MAHDYDSQREREREQAQGEPDDSRADETVLAYIARRHAEQGEQGCRCPRAFSRCKYAVIFDETAGDRSHGHGGWGWNTP